jgi:hypothetical protein
MFSFLKNRQVRDMAKTVWNRLSLPAAYQDNRISDAIAKRTPPWADSLDRNVLLVLVHIPKAGGTSMIAYFQHIYGRFLTRYHSRYNPNLFSEATPESVREILCITSHHPFGIHKQFGRTGPRYKGEGDGMFEGRDIRYVTVIRNPLDRMLSLYNYVTTFPAHRHHAKVKDMDIEQFYRYLDSINDPEIKNFQCGLVTGHESREFEVAKRFIDEKYFLAAPLERTEEFLDLLSRRMGWPNGAGEYQVRNVSPKSTTKDTVDARVRDMLLEWNSEDMKLYEHVRERFEREYAAARTS